MDKSTPKILWICSWFPNHEDQFRGDFIQRQAEALAGHLDFELAHFVEYASKTEVDYFNINKGCKVTIGYSARRMKLVSFRAQWRFYNRVLKEYIRRNGKPDLIHLHIPWKAGFVVRYWLKKYSIPYIVSEHYGIYNKISDDNFFTRSKRVQKYYHKIFNSASSIIAVSKSLGEELRAIFKKPFVTIPNVVDTRNFFFKNITVAETFSFLHISNMYKIKNTNQIIDAFAQAYKEDPSLRLELVGAQPLEIQKQIDGLDCKQAIKLKGEVHYKDVSVIMKEHHAFVLFSDWETQSCVALEALCSGRPVITSKVGGVQELIDKRNGVLVPAGNVFELTQAMLDVKKNYHQFHLEQIAQNAQDLYAYDQVANQLLKTYDQILAT